MNMKPIRLANLNALLKNSFNGNISRLASASRMHSDKNRNASFFNELTSGKKSFGEKLARTLEFELQLQPGSLDSIPTDGPIVIEPLRISWPFEGIESSRFHRLTAVQKAKIEGRIEEMICSFEAVRPPKKKRQRSSTSIAR